MRERMQYQDSSAHQSRESGPASAASQTPPASTLTLNSMTQPSQHFNAQPTPPQSSQSDTATSGSSDTQQSQIPTITTPSKPATGVSEAVPDSGVGAQIQPLHPLGQRPLRPATNRRLTIHDAASGRPSLLSRQIQFKSSSAVPTLSTTPALGGSATPTKRTVENEAATRTKARRASSGSRLALKRSGSMATRDVSATDLLRQAMMHRAPDDEHDQIGSTSSTPPGAVTPHPDLTDKRFPGINHNYFGQSTPPQTPRSRSRETENESGANTPFKSSKIISTEGTTIGAVLGKLTVTINEGRGLRPSIDPYVVCEFQLSQYISEGPVSGAASSRVENGSGGISIQQVAGKGRPMAIPMKSRQSSSSGRDTRAAEQVTNPRWDHKAVFDVVGEHAEIDVSVYDRTNQEAFLGHVRFCPTLKEYEVPFDGWFDLEPRNAGEQGTVTGQIRLKIGFQKTDKKHYGPEDFEVLKLIGKGTFGQVFQVRKRDTLRIYAMKVLSKKVIIQKKEIAHTIGERNILVRTAMTDSPFIVGLKFSFQTPSDLYLVTDYMSGGELFWHLQREGRFNETRAKFYIAELILALEHLHRHNIVYRDLKPENILLEANGHIALCDFGLSKANLVDSDTTNTFCGTTEYLAPEVLLDEQGYTKMVDYWSLGVLVFEMCCGWSPFYADDTQQMYRNIAFGKVRFPRDALSTEGRNFVKSLLNRNPKHRLGANGGAKELRTHPFFADVDWDALGKKQVVPPFKPKLKGELDVSNFDPEFTNARAAALASGINPASTPLSPTVQAKFEGFTFVDESAIEKHFADRSTEDLSRSSTREDDDDWEKIEKSNRMSGLHHSTDDLFHGRFEE